MTGNEDETPASEVLAVVGWLNATETVYQINGGWAVDALVGHQTRPHGDVDVFVDELRVPDFLDWLRVRGYRSIEDWLPVRIELSSDLGRVDVHPMRLDGQGDGVQQGAEGETYVHAAGERVTGLIGGRSVAVASASRLRELRSGYPPRHVDRLDLEVLRDL